MPAIEVCALVVRYGATTAVDRVSFTAESGRVTALLGPNGAGKTTIVETLEGYKRPAEGTVRVLGLDPIAGIRALAPRIGVMLQAGGIYPGMNARDALRLFAAYYDDPEPVAPLLERVGLSGVASTPWRRLSGGEQQRLSLGLALIGRPEVAFLDEPTAGVDPQGRIAIRDLIRDLRDGGVCVLLTTHELEEAERLADRVIIVDHGQVVADGSPSELRTMGGGASNELRFGAPPSIDADSLASQLGAPVTETAPGEYVVAAEPSPALVAEVTRWLAEHDLPLADLRAGRQTLEDVFLRLTGPSAAADARHPRERSRGRR